MKAGLGQGRGYISITGSSFLSASQLPGHEQLMFYPGLFIVALLSLGQLTRTPNKIVLCQISCPTHQKSRQHLQLSRYTFFYHWKILCRDRTLDGIIQAWVIQMTQSRQAHNLKNVMYILILLQKQHLKNLNIKYNQTKIVRDIKGHL